MPHLVSLVVQDQGKVHAVAEAWLAAGVTGMTVLDSSGLSHMAHGDAAPDGVPLFPSLRKIMEATEHPSRLLMSIVPDDFDLEGLMAATEKVLGSLDEPASGILFVVPVTHVRGLQPRPNPPESGV